MKLRISEAQWSDLNEKLNRRLDVESAGLLFGKIALNDSNDSVIVVQQVGVLPESSYLMRKIDQISIDPIYLNRVTKIARENSWCIFTIHTHPGSKEAWFSRADDAGDSKLMTSFYNQIPDAAHGSIVVTPANDAIGRVFSESGIASELTIQVVGETVKSYPRLRAIEDGWFSRQILALGGEGQSKLRQLRVGVVGLGGIGSIASMQLAHLGVKELVLIDGDVVESSNVSRVVGSMPSDAGRTLKVDVAARVVKSLCFVEKVETHPVFLTSEHEGLIAGCDIVFSCVDTHSSRALLNRFSYRYLVPIIDMGTVFRVNEIGVIESDAGRVVVVGPGKPCLSCWGHIDSEAIRIESLPKDQLEKQIEEGYVLGAQLDQPSVISFNTFVAGAGVSEMLRLATEFSGAEKPPKRLAFSFSEGVVKRNSLASRCDCTICGY